MLCNNEKKIINLFFAKINILIFEKHIETVINIS